MVPTVYTSEVTLTMGKIVKWKGQLIWDSIWVFDEDLIRMILDVF